MSYSLIAILHAQPPFALALAGLLLCVLLRCHRFPTSGDVLIRHTLIVALPLRPAMSLHNPLSLLTLGQTFAFLFLQLVVMMLVVVSLKQVLAKFIGLTAGDRTDEGEGCEVLLVDVILEAAAINQTWRYREGKCRRGVSREHEICEVV